MGDDMGLDQHRSDAHAASLALALRRIDATLPDRALLYGSAPPDARDLDLIVSARGAEAAGSALAAAGFRRRGSTWARFDGCAVDVVELLAAASLRLSPTLLAAMIEEGKALPGLRMIVAPAPAHALLLLAWRLRHARRLESKHARRIDRALHDDPNAWEVASVTTDPEATAALARLRRLAAGKRVSRPVRTRRPRFPHVLAVCSPDEGRAAFHAHMLSDAASALGYRGKAVLPGRWTTLRSWAAVVGRLNAGGAVVVASAALRPPRFAPPAVVEFVLASGGGGERVHRVDPELAPSVACERIASAAWEGLVTGGRLRASWKRLRGLGVAAR